MVDEKHLPGLLGAAGKSIAAMPEGGRVVERMKQAGSSEDFLFILRSADLGLGSSATKLITDAASDEEQWEDVKATLVRSAELQLTERYSSNA